jgi:hypothetical protein
MTAVDQITDFVEELLEEKPNFYGKVVFNFKAGRVPVVTVEESIKLDGGTRDKTGPSPIGPKA